MKSEETEMDLQSRIEAAEQAVIRRDARVRARLTELGSSSQRLASSSGLLWAAGTLASLLLSKPLWGASRSRAEGKSAGAGGAVFGLVFRLVQSWLQQRGPRPGDRG